MLFQVPEANPVLSINVIRVYIGGAGASGKHLRLWIKRSGVRAPLGSPSCVLEQEMFTPSPQALVIPCQQNLFRNELFI